MTTAEGASEDESRTSGIPGVAGIPGALPMNDERAAEGLDHLQAAALEMIKAARAFLDVAEDLVADREKVADVVAALGTVADVTTRAVRDRGVHGAAGEPEAPAGDAAGGGVQHIRVSS